MILFAFAGHGYFYPVALFEEIFCKHYSISVLITKWKAVVVSDQLHVTPRQGVRQTSGGNAGGLLLAKKALAAASVPSLTL